MWLDIVCSPTEIAVALAERPGAVCAVIDVVRATTSLAIMGERGVRQCLIAADIPSARLLRQQSPGMLLAGESGGRAPEGFDLGNSPGEMSTADLGGRDVAFATTNGTRAILASRASGAGAIITASLRNATAVARFALQSAADRGFLLVCAGRGQRLALDDLYAAGVIATHAQRLADEADLDLTLSESAELGLSVAETRELPLMLLRRSSAGRAVIDIGLENDLPWCAAVDATMVIPRVDHFRVDGTPVVTFV